jgi:hypothetical protein
MLVFFWKAGIPASIEARGYTLLLFISVLQTIAFANLLYQPTLRRATLWCGLASAAFATHYLSVYITAAEGLIYLGLYRKRAASTWPAILVFAPSLGWVALHWSRLRELSQAVAEWAPLDANATATALGYLIYWENWPIALAFSAILVLGLHVLSARATGDAPRQERQEHLAWTIAAGGAALACALYVGTQSASILPRYLTPLVPIVMLGLVLVAGRSARPTLSHTFLLAIFAMFAVNPSEHYQVISNRSEFGLQPSVEYLRGAKPDRVILALETKAPHLLKPTTAQHLVDTVFGRTGVKVIPVNLKQGADNQLDTLIKRATSNRAAIIWMRSWKSGPYSSDIGRRYPDWICRNPRGANGRFVACVSRRFHRVV